MGSRRTNRRRGSDSSYPSDETSTDLPTTPPRRSTAEAQRTRKKEG
ncbi:hypothetical protein ACP4OV_002305 [Aristida adscensionis]